MMVIITMMKTPTMMMTFSVVKSDGTSDVSKCSQIDHTSIRVSRGRKASQCSTEYFLFACLLLCFFCLSFFRKLTARQSGSVVDARQFSDLHFSPFLKDTTKVQSRTTRTVRKNMVTLQCLELVTANFQLEIVALESES